MIHLSTISRRHMLALGAGAIGLPSLIKPLSAEPATPIVVELFTSQGCSSCPPADAFMAELMTRSDVIALSLNVDYWNYLGWHDTLSQNAFTNRQRGYAAARGDGRVYTPQMVINGHHHAVGSNKSAVLQAIAQERKQSTASPNSHVTITLKTKGKELAIDVAEAPSDKLKHDCAIWVMMVAKQIPVTINRGENSGRTIIYHNVVRRLVPAGMWHGQKTHIELPKSGLFSPEYDLCVAVLQSGSTGPIIGAATMTAKSST